jgi:hypothetical protein
MVLGLAGLLVLWAIWSLNDLATYRSSLDNSRAILADFRVLGEEAEAFRARTGRYPSAAELGESVDPAALGWIGPDRWKQAREEWKLADMLGTAEPGGTCIIGEETRLSEAALGHFRLCHWRGEWMEEYVPATGEHSLPTSLEDYRPAWWQTLGIALLGFGFVALAVRLVLPVRRQWSPA